MKKLEEKKIRSSHLVDGALLQVYRDTVRLPDESESVREWIDHPGASAVVPLFPNGTTLLLRQYRYPARRVFWEVPAGKLDEKSEDPTEVALRELEEETGWRATDLHRMCSLYPAIGYSNEVIHFFLATGLTKGEQDLGDGEFLEVVRLPFAEALDMARRGDIEDMKSVIALLFAEQHQRSFES